VRKFWNEPIPFPIDIVEIRKVFYTVFETNKRSKYREILEKRIPLRLGSMSDSFMWLDKQFRVTHELMKILSFYNYPSLIFTRSDLVAEDEYLEVMNPKLTQVQFSLSSINESLTRQIEPGAPSPARRLAALQKLKEHGFKTVVRINPLIPHFPDGYYSDPLFDRTGVKEFPFFSWDMVDAIASAKVDTLLAGVVRLYRPNLQFMKKALGYDIREIFAKDVEWDRSSLHFSTNEVSYYYNELARLCRTKGLRFSTCYIGNDASGESFERYQPLWANQDDCCDAKGNVEGIVATCAQIPEKPSAKPNGASGCAAVKRMVSQLDAARKEASPFRKVSHAQPDASISP
jgi:DNA repair photolyase